MWFLVPTIIILVAGVWFLSKSSAGPMEEGSDLSLVPVNTPVEGTVEFSIPSRTHIAHGTSAADWISNPPTGGQHWDRPADNGNYDQAPADEEIVHSMEHGYVWISYRPADAVPRSSTSSAGLKPGLSEDEINRLKEIVKSDDWKIILSPRDKNDSVIALASWGRLLKMEEPDYDKIKDFIKTYRNRGPEKTPN